MITTQETADALAFVEAVSCRVQCATCKRTRHALVRGATPQARVKEAARIEVEERCSRCRVPKQLMLL